MVTEDSSLIQLFAIVVNSEDLFCFKVLFHFVTTDSISALFAIVVNSEDLFCFKVLFHFVTTDSISAVSPQQSNSILSMTAEERTGGEN
ncbi:hypothetical protein F511_32559 [Dorcoceras hygrometricum]|uniref:Uncharacterized protein n=1 Tax=Dorcoceras hygrometricum TaxID=472368 RepID=A0A2Z7C6L0_9LAMI|nr:hypothetical protein F511_32559 [Dorcoceras hygrometricum]